MTPFSVVKDFNIVKQAAGRFRPAEVPVMIYPFGFQQTKEAFCNCVVIAVPLATHATSHIMLGEQILVITGSVLTAPI